ncbi:MAG: hypothetical protein ACKO5F_10085 [Synechococcus sp.]
MSKASTIARTATIRVAVAVLSRGHEQLSDYAPLIQRNRALDVALRHDVGEAATNGNPAQANGNRSEPTISVEHLIFHEGNITPEQQIYIRARSRLAPLTFIDVSAEFAPTLPAQQESEWCPPANPNASPMATNACAVSGWTAFCATPRTGIILSAWTMTAQSHTWTSPAASSACSTKA